MAAGCCHPWPLAVLWLSDIGGGNPTKSSHASVATSKQEFFPGNDCILLLGRVAFATLAKDWNNNY